MSSALTGKRIVNTRAPHQAAELNRLLSERGAEALNYPCIDIAPPDDTTPLDEALMSAVTGGFDWLILTSANTVYSLKYRLAALNIAWEALNRMKIAVVGTATAAAAEEALGLQADVIPDEFVAESLAASLTEIAEKRVFLPQSAIAESTLQEALTAAGATVTVVDAYQTVIGSGGVDLPGLLSASQVDAITFTSPSTVHNLLQRLTTEGGQVEQLAGIYIACIGPKTARAIEKQGLTVSVMPDTHTIPGLIDALENYFARDE